MKTSILKRYREFDREKQPSPFVMFQTKSYDLEQSILKEGILSPVELVVLGNKALLTEGNNRLMIAIRNGIKDIPCEVRVTSREFLNEHQISRFKLINKRLLKEILK